MSDFICPCPLGATIPSIADVDCKEAFGLVGKLAFQRLGNPFTDITLQAEWDAALAAVDATNVIFATTDDAAKGVRLPALTTLAIGQTITVHNEAASTALRVYPASGDVIGGLAEDGHATVPAKTAVVLTKRDANKFLGYFTPVIA